MQTLTKLNLGSNQIGDEGAHHIAAALRNNTVTMFNSLFSKFSLKYCDMQAIQVLYLQWNRIGAVGARHIANTLQNNKVIFLILSYN